MTVNRTNEEINQAYIGPDRSGRLFNPHPREVCKEIGLKWHTALDLCDRGWLSFNPEAKPELERHEEAELRFVGSLVACGIHESQLGMLLNDLDRPYYYRIERIYFDWLARKWRLLPSVPVLDEIEDIIDALQREGQVDELRSLYEQIKEGLGINQMDYRKKIIAGIVAKECKKISSDIISRYEALTEGMQLGNNTPLNNLWDEICVQVQGEKSVFWDDYLVDISLVIQHVVENLDTEIKQAIWLQTDAGKDWETDREDHEAATFCEDDIKYYLQEIVLSAAAEWTNKEIEKYLGLEEDGNNLNEDSDVEETSEVSYLPETCVNIWLIADDDTQLIYRASARAYAISGTDDDKGRILKSLSRSDYHLARHFSLTNFKSNIIDLQGGERQVDGIFINSLDTNLPRIIEIICKGLESEFISQPVLTESGCKMYKQNIPREPLYVLTFLFENGAGELKVRKNALGALDAIARAFTGNPFVPLVAQEIMLGETASSEHYAGTKIRTGQLKKGARVRMRNGLEAIVVKECEGNTLIAKVFGAFTETGSIYAHNIVSTEVDGQWIEVEMTEEQARFHKEVKPFFDGNINIDTIKCK
jgi:hypothetical protein